MTQAIRRTARRQEQLILSNFASAAAATNADIMAALLQVQQNQQKILECCARIHNNEAVILGGVWNMLNAMSPTGPMPKVDGAYAYAVGQLE